MAAHGNHTIFSTGTVGFFSVSSRCGGICVGVCVVCVLVVAGRCCKWSVGNVPVVVFGRPLLLDWGFTFHFLGPSDGMDPNVQNVQNVSIR